MAAKFVGMESDNKFVRVFMPSTGQISTIKRADFKGVSSNELPKISTLLDGLSREAEIEAEESKYSNLLTDAEAHLVHAMTAPKRDAFPYMASSESKKSSIYVPNSFEEAQQHTEWRDAVDKEYRAHVERNTWNYVERSKSMNVIPFPWTFRAKIVDSEGKRHICEARCVAISDLQIANIDLDPEGFWARLPLKTAFDC